ncbi:MAG TPA: Sec-independent protein translocase protein TatB [Alphaproteobacteria bacterium]
MFDIGGAELLVIAVVALVVLGPKELPTAVRTVQGFVKKARELARDFQTGLGEMAREIELDKMKAEVKSAFDAGELDKLGNSIQQEFDSTSDELKKSLDPGSLKDYVPPAPGELTGPAEIAAADAAQPPVDAAPPEIPPENVPPSLPSPKPGA